MHWFNCTLIRPSRPKFMPSASLIQVLTYAFSTVGIILNLSLILMLGTKRMQGSFSIVLLLISDTLLCCYYFSFIMVVDLRGPFHEYKKAVWIPIGLSNFWVVCMVFNRCMLLMLNSCSPNRRPHSINKTFQSKIFQIFQFFFCIVGSSIATFVIGNKSACTIHFIFYVIPVIFVFLLCILSVVTITKLLKTKKIELPPMMYKETDISAKKKPGMKCQCMCCSFYCVINKISRRTKQNTVESGISYDSWPLKMSPNTASSLNLNADNITRIEEYKSIKSQNRQKRRMLRSVLPVIIALATSFIVIDTLQVIFHVFGVSSAPLVKNTCSLVKTMTNAIILCIFNRRFRKIATLQLSQLKRKLTACCAGGCCYGYCTKKDHSIIEPFNININEHPEHGSPGIHPQKQTLFETNDASLFNRKKFRNLFKKRRSDSFRGEGVFYNRRQYLKQIKKREKRNKQRLRNINVKLSRCSASSVSSRTNEKLSMNSAMASMHKPARYSQSVNANSISDSQPSVSYTSAKSDSHIAKIQTSHFSLINSKKAIDDNLGCMTRYIENCTKNDYIAYYLTHGTNGIMDQQICQCCHCHMNHQ